MRPTKIGAGLAAASTIVILGAAPAFAQVAEDGNVTPDAPLGSVLTINNTWVTILLGVVAPLVTGFLLRPQNPPAVKLLVASLVGIGFHAVSEVVQQDGTAVFSQEWLVKLVLLLAAEFGTYTHVWNPVFASKGGVNAATGPGVIPATSGRAAA
jgi:hypothetical protein